MRKQDRRLSARDSECGTGLGERSEARDRSWQPRDYSDAGAAENSCGDLPVGERCPGLGRVRRLDLLDALLHYRLLRDDVFAIAIRGDTTASSAPP